MLEDKTYKIKTYDHNDAVIYVTQHDHTYRDGKATYSTEVIAVIPVNCSDGPDDILQDKVKNAVNYLAELYSTWPDGEIKIQYVINVHPWVNV